MLMTTYSVNVMDDYGYLIIFLRAITYIYAISERELIHRIAHFCSKVFLWLVFPIGDQLII